MRTVGSREYKMMLNASKFKGDDAELLQTATELWADLAGVMVPYVLSVSGISEVENKRRQVRFLDTKDRWLRSQNYVVRERVDLDKDEREVTLKFRHADRYISADRDMAPGEKFKKDMKFEEDIKPKFESVYSFSSNTIVPAKRTLASLADVKALYPGLPKAFDDFPEAEELQVVGGFTGYERVLKGTRFQIRQNPDAFADCSVTLWYEGETDDKPKLAEFSFKYEDPDENYTGKMARRAYDGYMAMQSGLERWIDAKSRTKTAYVFSLKD